MSFTRETEQRILSYPIDAQLKEANQRFMEESIRVKYSYNFKWFGRPIIQYPQDVVAMQELIWSVRPDLIIETGIAHGGSLIFSASMLALLDLCDSKQIAPDLTSQVSKRKVLGLDIDIREHNRKEIESHPLASYVQMIQGSSIDPGVIAEAREIAKDFQRVLVCLDSNHTHEHVLAELKNYAPLVSAGSYCVVFDTIVEDMPKSMFPDRPWGPGDNPKTAVWEYLKDHPEFEIDRSVQQKLLITVAPDGFLKRIS